jgi:hypothetical protein
MKFLPATFLLASAVAKAADTNALPALAPAYGEMPPTFWEQHGTLFIIGGFAFVILAMLVLWKLFQPKPAVILPPEFLAREALAKLIGRPEDGKLLSDVSQILRRYVIAAFNFPAAEMTTAEFCTALADNEKIGAELAGSISSFLRECDERKFSTSPATAPLNAAARTLEIISRLEARRASVGRASSRAELSGSSGASPHQLPESK